MINLDEDLACGYLLGCDEHVATLKAAFLALNSCEPEINERSANNAFRAVHSIVAGRFFDLRVVSDLAQQLEDVLALIRARKMALSAHGILVLRRAADTLGELFQNPSASNDMDITQITSELHRLCLDNMASNEKMREPHRPSQPNQPCLRTLLVEDDEASRLLLQTFLSRHGNCDVATNGREAVEAFRYALARGARYDLVCMDMMMPEMDGREALRQIRAMEASSSIPVPATKIIMTTAINDAQEVFLCFRESCNAYLLKPIDLTRLLALMKTYKLVE